MHYNASFVARCKRILFRLPLSRNLIPIIEKRFVRRKLHFRTHPGYFSPKNYPLIADYLALLLLHDRDKAQEILRIFKERADREQPDCSMIYIGARQNYQYLLKMTSALTDIPISELSPI